MPYTYKYPHPAVTADLVALRYTNRALHLLLIQRKSAPYQGRWALPGGFIEIDEDLPDGARRELREETGLTVRALTQVGAFGRPQRDPRERVISVAFYAAVAPDARESPQAADDAQALRWAPIAALPPLAFDHRAIIAAALARARHDFTHTPLARELLPPTFPLADLHACAEAVLGRRVHVARLRRSLLRAGVLHPAASRGRYRFDAAAFRRRPRALGFLEADA